ncbi:MAG: SDR family NAD(P)-dependent oxidoreductase, partial [Actinobacteria bacterium]|nr:SDR family NAD(P)-dependent oxidoreductase [Actinomycetota bacterium]
MTSSLIATPFTVASTTTDVLSAIDLTGIRAVVTGASSGLGRETARALAAAGAEVTMAVRNTEVGAAIADAIAREGAPVRPRVSALDLSDQASVARFIDTWVGPLHLLVNNAGLVTGGLERTAEGWELQFATNFLGHFALTVGLHTALAAGAADRGGSRIVSLSSTA